MADRMIGAGPGFDPHANSRASARRGRLRGNKLTLVLAVALLFLIGMLVFQHYAPSWRSSPAKAAIEVRPNSATLTTFKFDPVTMPAVVDPLQPAPPKEITVLDKAPPKREPPPRGSGAPRAAKPELPSRVTWDVQVAGAPPTEWLMDGRRPHLFQGCALRPGASIIPAVLETVIQSEVPGQVIAAVSEDVFDVDGVGRLLIPQGSKLVGLYKSDLTLGSRRLGMVWTELVKPDGSQLTLGESFGMDSAGSMGVGGEVRTAWGQVIGVAALFSIFQAAQQQTAPDDTYAGALADSSADQFSRTGQRVIGRMLEQAVKIRIPAGTQIRVSVGKTIQVC